MSTMTKIISNGSRWAGQQPAEVSELLNLLATEPLRRVFEAYGNFIMPEPKHGVESYETGKLEYVDGDPIYPEAGVVRFWGNFETCSHVFQIDTSDPELIAKLTAAIRANQQRADYLGKPAPKKDKHA